jgi:hypothetical protein
MNFPVSGPTDFEPVEAHIAAVLACEPGRCAFLRSALFLGFRMRALYRAAEGDFSACTPQGLLLQFIASGASGGGGLVTVRRHDTADTFDDTWGLMWGEA